MATDSSPRPVHQKPVTEKATPAANADWSIPALLLADGLPQIVWTASNTY